MSTRAAGRTVGALFLLAYVFYLGGSMLVDSGTGTADILATAAGHQGEIAAGAVLMLLNSVAVAGIGVLALPVLRRGGGEISAHAYLVARVIEAMALAVGVVFLLSLIPLSREYAGGAPGLAALARVAKEGNFYGYQIGMMSLCLGGLLFCRVLLRARLVPRPLAVLGLAGYLLFLVETVLGILGSGLGPALLVPGALFEVGVGVLLVVRGFPEPERALDGLPQAVPA
ncbi:DUF4386 domain-containing protein [Nonomuraea sp. NPDC050643]|uniref:DUF4386 domain-containing protein n=1 Tax=Nonomuraea sp. NPDC050643 TaxID=3155660 RepID=UPI0033CAB6F6